MVFSFVYDFFHFFLYNPITTVLLLLVVVSLRNFLSLVYMIINEAYVIDVQTTLKKTTATEIATKKRIKILRVGLIFLP